MKATAIGIRSQTSVSFDGARWYQADPTLVSATPTKNTIQGQRSRGSWKSIRLRRRNQRPVAPTTAKARLESTLSPLGTPQMGRVSANW